MPTLYIETSIVSYLRDPPSSQVVAAARQILTRRWWDRERGDYDLVTSQYVIDEAGDGDPMLARDRLALLAGVPLLPVIPEIAAIAEEILARKILPPSAAIDTLHISVVAHHRVEYLLTWHRALGQRPESPAGLSSPGRSRPAEADHMHAGGDVVRCSRLKRRMTRLSRTFIAHVGESQRSSGAISSR